MGQADSLNTPPPRQYQQHGKMQTLGNEQTKHLHINVFAVNRQTLLW